ncbi:MAG: ABC transporter ATP-binding protein [Alphaproteobacteria bacterium]|nr:ABC transporter ATP-binding protein [Alphaproteobacteria bacterium]
MSDPFLTLEHISRVFHQGDRDIHVLNDVTLHLYPKQITALLGPSGAGKSTILHIAGLLEKPSKGDVKIAGKSTRRASDGDRTKIRRQQLGFVYQAHHLLPEFSALENVMLPLLLNATPKEKAKDKATQLLERVGLKDRLNHRPAQMSGGEQQRVAIARALANKPKLLLADEPTGNLDPHTAESVFQMLIQIVREEELSILIATHNHELLPFMDRILKMEDGKIIEIQATRGD